MVRTVLQKCTGAAFGLWLVFSSAAFAEQPAAERYREMFRSGRFYVAYGRGNVQDAVVLEPGMAIRKNGSLDAYKKQKSYLILAGRDGKRMHGVFGGGWIVDFQRELVSLSKAKTTPDVLYADGSYYRSMSEIKPGPIAFSKGKQKVTVYMLPEALLGSPLLDPKEKWPMIRKDLALPDELAIFCWRDAYRDLAQDAEAPCYTNSSTRTLNGKRYDCDTYVLDKKAPSGKVLSQEIYRAFYEAGTLAYVQKLVFCSGAEELKSMIDVREIAEDASTELFAFPVGTKIYAAGGGDMNDLTEDAVLLARVGDPKAKKAVEAEHEEGKE